MDEAARARLVITNWEALSTALARGFGGAVEDEPQFFRFRSNLHSGFMNGVIRADVPPAEVPDLIDGMRAWFPDGLPWRWVVGPGSGPADLADRLQAAGFEKRWPHMPCMTIDLADFDAGRWIPSDLQVSEALDAAGLEGWLSVRRRNLGLDETTMAAWRRGHGELGLGPTSALRQFVGRVDGEPVASSTLYLDAGGRTAGIYHVDVLADCRGRGFGKAITAAALGAARDAGVPIGVLSASKLGTPAYLGLGFRAHGGLAYFVGAAH